MDSRRPEDSGVSCYRINNIICSLLSCMKTDHGGSSNNHTKVDANSCPKVRADGHMSPRRLEDIQENHSTSMCQCFSLGPFMTYWLQHIALHDTSGDQMDRLDESTDSSSNDSENSGPSTVRASNPLNDGANDGAVKCVNAGARLGAYEGTNDCADDDANGGANDDTNDHVNGGANDHANDHANDGANDGTNVGDSENIGVNVKGSFVHASVARLFTFGVILLGTNNYETLIDSSIGVRVSDCWEAPGWCRS